jgi:glycosyltransferase involved in cell wall biosynthesis
MRRLKIFTWPNCPRYCEALARLPHELCFPGPGTKRQKLDCIVFQDESHYLDDQFEVLSPAQRRLPKIYVEHEPPREHPVESRHVVTDSDVLIVHVNEFNRLMWDNGRSTTRVIEHGVADRASRYTGEIARGLVCAEDLQAPDRRHGADLLLQAQASIALGCGELDARYRFLFFPARYKSPSIALIEAMMIGMPALAPASGPLVGVIRDGMNGYVDASPERLIGRMRELLSDREAALTLGREARRLALERFSIQRFVADWNSVLAEATGATGERFAA